MNIADVSPELDALLRALAGRPAPCQGGDAEVWFDPDPQLAIRLCRTCPGIDACQVYAATVRPTAGVWAGKDFERRGRHHTTKENR